MNKSRSKYWAQTDQDKIAALVEALVRSRGPAGWPYGIEYELRSHALAATLKLPKVFHAPWAVAGNALAKMHAEGLAGLAAFEKCIDDRVRELLVEFKKHRGAWWFILPTKLPISLKDEVPRCLKLFGSTFGIMRIDALESYLGASFAHLGPVDRYAMQGEQPSTVIVVQGYGFPLEQVWNSLSPAFDALRGIIEWTLNAGVVQLGAVEQFGTVPHPRIAICLSDRERAFVLRFAEIPDWEVSQDDRKSSRGSRLVSQAARFASEFPNKPEAQSIDRLIADQLRLYSQAMDQRYRNGAILGFWQMAEALTLDKEDRGAGDRVVARLAWFERFLVQQETGAVGTALRCIMQKRNAAVHEGLHFQWDNVELNLIKQFCEAGLAWLINSRQSLRNSSDLRRFWEQLPYSDEELANRTRIIEFIRRSRETASSTEPTGPSGADADVY